MLAFANRAAALAVLITAAAGSGALAQDTADPHHPGEAGRGQPGMMGQEMMGGMMEGSLQPGMREDMSERRMHGHMIKMMFAVVDADGDGGLSFEEIAAIQRRVFNAVDADEDGNVTPEEMQTFMRE